MSHAYLELDLRPVPTPGDAHRARREPARAPNDDRRRQPRGRLSSGALGVDRVRSRARRGSRASTSRSSGADGYTLPATQHDVVVWLAGAAYDLVFDVSTGVVSALAALATLSHEMVGWPYHLDRDLTGFEDGTENPTLVEATSAAIIEAGAPGRGRQRPPAPAVGARRRRAGRRCSVAEQEAVDGSAQGLAARSSTRSPRRRTSRARTRTCSARSSDATSATAP